MKKYGNSLSILQCTTAYPTAPEQWGLNVIQELKDRYQLPIGFSDHSGDIFASLSAASLGAEIFEFHVVFDKRQFGPDTLASITIDQTEQMVKGIKAIQKALKNPIDKTQIKPFQDLKKIFEKKFGCQSSIEKRRHHPA